MKWCAWQDSNLYAFRHQILSLNQYFNYQLVKFLYTVCTHFRFVNENELWDTFNREEIPEKTLWFTYLSYLENAPGKEKMAGAQYVGTSAYSSAL